MRSRTSGNANGSLAGLSSGRRGGRVVERVVVALILIILMAVAFVGVRQVRGKSVSSACRYDVGLFNHAAEVYALQPDHLGYPVTILAFEPLVGNIDETKLSADGRRLEKQGYFLEYDPVVGRITGRTPEGSAC